MAQRFPALRIAEPAGVLRADGGGLICAFRLSPFSHCEEEVLDGKAFRGPVWLHFNLTDTRARRFIEQCSRVPEAARSLLLDPHARVHFEPLTNALAVVLGDIYHDFNGDPNGVGTLRVYLDAECMITARIHPLRSIDRLRRELSAGYEAATSPIKVFELLLSSLVHTYASMVSEIEDEVDEAEDEILGEGFRRQSSVLGRDRRLLARLRRYLNVNRSALSQLSARAPLWCDVEQWGRVRAAAERLSATTQDLELVQERARLLQEEIASRVADATNKNLFILSIATTTLLPITLITGIFGMNVGGLPFSSETGFNWVMLGIALAVIVVLLVLHRLRVF